MPRRKPVELNVNHERWLVSYADFITLLFAFFVVMYSVSQVNESKYRILSDTLVNAFSPASSLKPIQVGERNLEPTTSAIDLPGGESGGPVATIEDRGELQQLSEIFTEQFESLIEDDLVQVSSNEFWLQIEVKDSILFASASADPSPRAREIFSEIAGILKDYDNPVQVEGHTDNLPIRSQRYPSNWELSAARATSMVKLLESDGVAAERLSAVGYAEHQPMASNDTEEGRARNRRVTLMIARAKMERPSAPVETQLERSGAGLIAEPEQVEAVQSPDTEQAEPPEPAPGPEPEAVLEPDPDAVVIDPVELEDGGLLFTSDPDLPRERSR